MVRRKERLLRRKECLAGHVWLATCKQTSPNPPSSSFQLKWLLCCLRASPDTPALLLSPREAVSPLLNGNSSMDTRLRAQSPVCGTGPTRTAGTLLSPGCWTQEGQDRPFLARAGARRDHCSGRAEGAGHRQDKGC